MEIMGSEGDHLGASKNESAKVLKGRSLSVPRSVGGGLVVGIVTIVAVGLAGKLLSKFRKPRLCSTNSTSTPFITPANSLDKIVNGDNPDLLMHLEGETQLPNKAVINDKSTAVSLELENGGTDQNETSTTTPVINGESTAVSLELKNGGTDQNETSTITPVINGKSTAVSIDLENGGTDQNETSTAVSIDLENGGTDQNETSTTTPDAEERPDSISRDLDTVSSLGNNVDRSSSSDLQSDSGFAQDSKSGDESRDERGDERADDHKLSTTSVVLSELVNNALLDAKNDSLSEHELLSKTTALTEEIKGVISRAIEDFNSCGETSSDELTPTNLKTTATWETNSSSGSEEEAAQVHSGESLADKELLPPASTETEAGEKTIESVKDDAPQRRAEEEVLEESVHSSSELFEEQTDEPKGTPTGGNDMEREEQLGQEEETGTLGGSERVNPRELMPEVQQEKMEPDRSLAPLPMNNEITREINEISSLLDDTPTLSLPAKGASSDDEMVKKQNISQVCEQLHNEAEIFKLNVDTEAEIFKLTSILLRSTNTSSSEITEVDDDVDSIQISTEITEELAEEKEGTPLTVKSSLVLPAISHEESTVRKIVAAKESAGAAGTQSKTTVVTTTVEFTSNGGLKRELQNRRGNRSSLEVLTLAIIVALIAALVWPMRTGTSLVRSL